MSWNPQERVCRLVAGITQLERNLFYGRKRRISDQPKLLGGARRDRTDDLMLAKHALSQLSYGPLRRTARISLTARRAARPNGRRELLRERPVGQRQIMVGLGRLELPTSRLSSARSNQLSYKPGFIARASSAGEDQSVWHLVHGRKRNEGGGVPHVGSD
jgi:hypothetical protein